jgi:acetaldehyde dehydrogenase (acetylating)
LSLYFVADFAAAMDTCFALLKFGGAGHTCAIYAKDDARIRAYALRMPAYRVLVNTPAPQGSTGITTNVFPSMTLGCGAMAGNSTSDNVGPQHLINIKRLAYVVRKPEEAFEMPLDYNAAPSAVPAGLVGPVDRGAIVAAVERYLASRGIVVSAGSGTAAPSCGCSHPETKASVVANVAAEVVDRFLAKRSGGTQGGYG